VDTVKDDGQTLYRARDIAKVLGIGNIHDNLRRIHKSQRRSFKSSTNGGGQNTVFLTENAVLYLVSRSRSHRSKELGEHFGMRCIDVVYPPVEGHALSQLQRAFRGQLMETQYTESTCIFQLIK